uniref:Uncharacterized protein n=1 Tax=viral metagenome TaxID=1070528 RepID=A0A6C0F3H1_9ZZZZ
MDTSYLTLISFIVLTIVYFAFPTVGKLKVTSQMLEEHKDEFQIFYTLQNMPRLMVYFLFVIFFQFFFNSIYIINKCGGSASKNIGVAALLTFIPWILIFGIMIAVLIMFPGLKSAFSDVVGYFVVANGANNILNVILENGDLSDKIDETSSDGEKKELKVAAQAIMKLVGNKGILINQMVPGNFESIWTLLEPLMVPDFVNKQMTGDFDYDTAKNKLLDLVVLRDNIGESMWYIYTAILLTSIVSYNLATRGCVKDVQQMKAAHDDYLQQQEETNKQNELNNSVVYKVT